VVDHWWQTETGWPIAANCLGIEQLPIKPGSPTRAVPGYDVRVLGDDGKEVPDGEIGSIMIRLPLPPGTLPTLWGNDQRYIDSYLSAHQGWYLTGDAGYRDEDGYLWIMSRIDDIINTAGHRLSTGAMEECSPRTRTSPRRRDRRARRAQGRAAGRPGGAQVRRDPQPRRHQGELVQMVRDRIGPVASFKKVAIVDRLPKTRSGKVLRATMRKIADGQDYRVPPTIDDPAILDEVTEPVALKSIGYGKVRCRPRAARPGPAPRSPGR
jgi:propionyl-CoA synthetase